MAYLVQQALGASVALLSLHKDSIDVAACLLVAPL
jgi:hypothetical protein